MKNATLTDRQLRFVAKPRIAVLATVRADGSPHTAPVWYRFEDGAFLVLTDKDSQKHRNIQRDPRAELCIDDRERPPFHTVIVRGRATLHAAPGPEWRLALAVHYLGDESGRRYIESTDGSGGVLLRIEPERVTGW